MDDVMPPLEQIRGTDIGLQIITKNSVGWPRSDEVLSLRRLIEGIDSGKYNWLYSDNTYPEEAVYTYMINNEIDLDNCWCRIVDSRFNKIRNMQS